MRMLLPSALPRVAQQVLPLAALLALVSSSQYLFQPFVWRHWPVDMVLLGWLEILGDRLLVATCVAVATVVALTLRLERRGTRGVALALAIVAGAAAGEALGYAWALPGAPSTLTDAAERVLRWSVFAAGIVGLWQAWTRALAADAAVRNTTQAKAAAERQLTALQVQALQAQVEPHFLFNTLATVKRLSSVEPARCRQLLAHLHTFVRLSQAAQPAQLRWTVGEEVELARAYLGVVEMRMNGRLRVAVDVAPSLAGFDVPPLALTTLVENAVKHGITPLTGDGTIVVRGRRHGAVLELQIADTGVGFQASTGSGIGLANTRARLRSLYKDDASLQLGANRPRGVVATLRLPARTG
jgi:hypothetical protein